jgi:hypothetical protein
MRNVRIALKYLTLGLVAGLLLAPRAGRETRQQWVERITALVK